MKVRLEVSHKSGKKRVVNIHSDAVIGRSTECSLRIASSEISRKHCKLTVIESGVLVRDLESANGTWIDGKMIPPARDVALPPGSRLSIGPVQFLVHYESSNPAIDPPGSTVELPALPNAVESVTPSAPAAAVADEPVSDDVQIEQNEPADAAEDDSAAVATVVVQPEEAQQAIADALADRVADIEAESAADVMDVEEVEDAEVDDAEVDDDDAADNVVGVVGTEIEEPAAEPADPEPAAPPSTGKLGGMLGGLLKFGRKSKAKTTTEEPATSAVDATEDAADVADVEETDAVAANDEAPQIAPPAEPDLEPDVESEEEGEEGYYEDGEEEYEEEEYEDEEEVDAELGDFFSQFEDK